MVKHQLCNNTTMVKACAHVLPQLAAIIMSHVHCFYMCNNYATSGHGLTPYKLAFKW